VTKNEIGQRNGPKLARVFCSDLRCGSA